MGLKMVALAETIVIEDITEKELVKIEITDVDGVPTVLLTFMEPDSRGLLRPQTESQPLKDTMAVGAFKTWLNKLVS